MVTLGQGDINKKQWSDCNLTLRRNVTRWMGLVGERGIWTEMAMAIGQGIIKNILFAF